MPDMRLLMARGGLLPAAAAAGACSCAAAWVAAMMTRSTKPLQGGRGRESTGRHSKGKHREPQGGTREKHRKVQQGKQGIVSADAWARKLCQHCGT
jgi:hypothetical protein